MTHDAFITDAHDTAKRLRWAFFANGYDLTIVDATTKNKKCKRGTVTASVHVDHAYLVIVITLYKEAFEVWKTNRAKFMHILVHEFCHFVIDPVFDIAWEYVPEELEPILDERREAAVERMARMLVEADQPGHVLDAIKHEREPDLTPDA